MVERFLEHSHLVSAKNDGMIPLVFLLGSLCALPKKLSLTFGKLISHHGTQCWSSISVRRKGKRVGHGISKCFITLDVIENFGFTGWWQHRWCMDVTNGRSNDPSTYRWMHHCNVWKRIFGKWSLRLFLNWVWSWVVSERCVINNGFAGWWLEMD